MNDPIANQETEKIVALLREAITRIDQLPAAMGRRWSEAMFGGLPTVPLLPSAPPAPPPVAHVAHVVTAEEQLVIEEEFLLNLLKREPLKTVVELQARPDVAEEFRGESHRVRNCIERLKKRKPAAVTWSGNSNAVAYSWKKPRKKRGSARPKTTMMTPEEKAAYLDNVVELVRGGPPGRTSTVIAKEGTLNYKMCNYYLNYAVKQGRLRKTADKRFYIKGKP